MSARVWVARRLCIQPQAAARWARSSTPFSVWEVQVSRTRFHPGGRWGRSAAPPEAPPCSSPLSPTLRRHRCRRSVRVPFDVPLRSRLGARVPAAQLLLRSWVDSASTPHPPPPARLHPTRPWRPGALRLLPLLLLPPCVQVAGGCFRMRHHWGPAGRHRTSPVARGGGRRSCFGRLWRPCPSGQLCPPPLVARAWQLRAAAAPMAAPTVRGIPQVWSRRCRQRMPRRRRQRRRPPPRGPQSPPTRRPPACARRLRRPSARLVCLCLAPRPRLRALGVW